MLGSPANNRSEQFGACKPIDSVIVLEQIEAFIRITTKELSAKVLSTKKLLETKINLEHLVWKYSMPARTLTKAFPILNSRDDIHRYIRIYSLGPRASLLFPYGPFASNTKLDALMVRLGVEFQDLHNKMFECVFTLKLLAAPMDNRDMFDHSFLETTIIKFKAYEDWASQQFSKMFKTHLDFYGEQVLEVARKPQFADLRLGFKMAENNFFLEEIVRPIENLFGIYLKLVDYLDKHQEKLNVLLTSTRIFHLDRIAKARKTSDEKKKKRVK